MRLSDSDLIRQMLEGNTAAFEMLIERYKDSVYGFAFHLVRDFSDAQDLTQEIFLAAYRSLNKLRDHSKLAAWLRGITANLCMAHLRKQRDFVSLESLTEVEQETAFSNAGRLVMTPSQSYEREELSKIVREAIETLPEKHQLCVTLYFIDGLSYGEIGGFLDVPVNTVKSWMYRAKRKLRGLLQMVEKEFGEQKLEPQFTQQVMEKGHEYFKSRKWGEAVHEFRKTAEMKPDSADVHHWLGRAYAVYASRGSGSTCHDAPCEETIDAAIDEYKKAIELDPDHGSAHAHLAYLYHLRKGMIDEAVAEYKKAAEIGGMDAEDEHAVYNNLGHIYRDKGMYGEALKWFDKAVRLDPSVSYVPWGIATVYAVQGKAHEAVEYLRQAVELGQDPKRILRDDVSNELFDNIRETKEFQDFIRSIKR